MNGNRQGMAYRGERAMKAGLEWTNLVKENIWVVKEGTCVVNRVKDGKETDFRG